jgi:hypothetical protein
MRIKKDAERVMKMLENGGAMQVKEHICIVKICFYCGKGFDVV